MGFIDKLHHTITPLIYKYQDKNICIRFSDSYNAGLQYY
jgi:hypothetical protein